MKILAVSDVVLERLHSAQVTGLFQGIDMVLGCGDLPYGYLEFLVSMLNVPVLFVPGNHDPEFNQENPAARADGCDLIDRRVTRVRGLNLAGLGGSIRYKPTPPNQYTQSQMYLRLFSILPALLWQRIQTGSGLDIVIAHSPPHGIHDDTDQAHVGFLAFREIIRVFKPRYFLHGHTLVYKSNLLPPVTRVGATTVINVYPYKLLEVDTHA